MTLPGQMIRQRDFSAGELVEYAKRADDDKIMRAGGRQMRNWRILNSRAMEIRPGRTALFSEPGRTDEVRLDSSTIYRLSFGNGTFRVRDASGAFVFGVAGLPWSVATIDQITWAAVDYDVVICFPGMKTKIARWDGASTWTFLDYSFRSDGAGLPRCPFYRIAAKGITMLPSGTTGSVTLTFSAAVLLADHVGAVFNWANKRIRITAVASSTSGTGTCLETLLPCQRLTVPAGNENAFAVGDVVIGSATNAQGEVTSINATSHYVYVQNLTLATGFTTSDTIVGPSGRSTVSAVATVTPQATSTWSEQAISDARGWPQSVSTDVNRIIFCDLPSIPEGIIWSAIGTSDDLLIGSTASDAMMEVMTGKPRVYHVIGGQDEFVFTNKGVRYIPISASNPLRPGSVQFLEISPDACASIRPVATADGVVYLNEGKTRLIAILPTGQVTRPYATQEMSQWHAHLIKTPIALAASTGDGEFPERYVYVVNADGTMAVGRYDRAKQWVGFVPWESAGLVKWISVLASRLILSTEYSGDGDVTIVESVSAAAYIDGAVELNDIPAALAAGTGATYEIFDNAGDDIGNMTAGGGNEAWHDGVTSKAAAACAMQASGTGWAGKALPSAHPVKSVELYPSNDNGFALGEGGNITLELRAKASATTTGADGVLLGSTSIADVTSGPITINSNDDVTAYPYVWVRVINLTATNTYLAQAKFYRTGQVLASPSGGTGDLWFYAGAEVDLADGLKPMGTRAVNASGNLVEETGDDLSSATLNAGFAFESEFEPFVPHAGEGQSVRQSARLRSIKQAIITVQESTGFMFGTKRVAPWRVSDDGSAAPPQREETLTFRPLGRSHDPRISLVKDTPGTLRVLEVGLEVNV